MIAWLGLAASVLSVVGSGIKLVEPGFEILFTIGFSLMMLFEIIFVGWLLFYLHKSGKQLGSLGAHTHKIITVQITTS